MVPTVDLDALDPEALRRLAFRRRRTWAAAVVGNALVLLVMVGGPWYRGRDRAHRAREGFARVAACLWGAEPNPAAGLTFPDGDLAHYADAARGPDWPRRCLPLLDDVVPRRVFFVFPEVRQAEADARRAVEVVRQEMQSVSPAEPGVVATRPRLAMLRLSAALSLVARAVGADLALDEPAILPRRPAQSVLPERVPLQVEASALLEVRGWADGVELLALGERALSWVRVGGGRVDLRCFRRPRALRGWVRDGATPWLLWWTSENRCGDDRCARRALGLAPLLHGTVTTPTPHWLAAHPSGGARGVAVGRGQVWVAARTDAATELRRFTAPEEHDASHGAARPDSSPTPREADAAWALPGASGVRVGAEAVWWVADESLYELRDGERRRLVRVGAARQVARDGPWVAAWGPGLVLLRRGHPVPTPAAGAMDALRVVGSDERAFVVIERAGRLSVCGCDADRCGSWWEVAVGVDAWDVVFDGSAAFVAWAESERGPVAIREIQDGIGPVTFPAPCFDTDALTGRPSGMCGAPALGASQGRIFLVAREGTDAWVVERDDGRWRPLRGLR